VKLVLRNQDIKRVLVGPPKGHKHVRAIIEAEDLVIVLQEATLANIVRAYITVKTHPTRSAIELKRTKPEHRKEGYAEYQLLETEKLDEEVSEEISTIIYSNPSS